MEQMTQEIMRLKTEVQQQKGMLWVFGEMMKAAYVSISFKELMATLVDMLMGILGVTSCYLWVKMDGVEMDNYTVFYKSIELNNEFKEKKHSAVPFILNKITKSEIFNKSDIKGPLIEGINTPSSRLAVPLYDFEKEKKFGILVVEHEEEFFFSDNIVAFFETLSVYITVRALSSKRIMKIAEQSTKDPLTGVYNRGYLAEAIEDMAHQYENIVVAIIDTDNFKVINDKMGHIVGDTVLRGLSHLAENLVIDYKGKVIRYGGDEFVIILPVCQEEALEILESFRKEVTYLNIAYHLSYPISVTIGVCGYPDIVGECGENLIKAADSALLRGKEQGKNKIILATKQDIN